MIIFFDEQNIGGTPDATGTPVARKTLYGLRVDHLPSPNFEFEDSEEQYKLALKWDSLGLLRLVDGVGVG